jgi:hypothetical protein
LALQRLARPVVLHRRGVFHQRGGVSQTFGNRPQHLRDLLSERPSSQ